MIKLNKRLKVREKNFWLTKMTSIRVIPSCIIGFDLKSRYDIYDLDEVKKDDLNYSSYYYSDLDTKVNKILITMQSCSTTQVGSILWSEKNNNVLHKK